MKPKLTSSFSFLRYASVAIVAFAAAFGALDQRDPGVVTGHGMYDHYVYTFGWPLVAGTHQISEPMLRNPPQGMERIEHWNINWWAAAFDLCALAIIVGCTFWIARFYLPLFRFGRISLSAMFVAMTTSAVLILLLTWELEPMRRLIASISTPVGSYHPITLSSWWISLPVLYGMCCVSVVMANFLGDSTRRLTWFLR